MSEQSQLPRGGVDLCKYAAVTLALALTRGALFDALDGNLEGVQRILDLTATSTIAEALGCTESDLVIIWDEYLTQRNSNAYKDSDASLGDRMRRINSPSRKHRRPTRVDVDWAPSGSANFPNDTRLQLAHLAA